MGRVSDACEPGASGEDVEGDGWVVFGCLRWDGSSVLGERRLSRCGCAFTRAFGRVEPTLATMRLSRRWGTRLWWCGQMWATRTVDARYQLFLSGEGKVSCGFRLKNHPAEAGARKPKT